MELEQVGTYQPIGWEGRNIKVLMVIKAPKGSMAITTFDETSHIWDDTRCEAIKAFMKEHKND